MTKSAAAANHLDTVEGCTGNALVHAVTAVAHRAITAAAVVLPLWLLQVQHSLHGSRTDDGRLVLEQVRSVGGV